MSLKKLFGIDSVGKVVESVGEYLGRRHELKLRKLDNEARVEEARVTAYIDALTKRADADIKWEHLSIQNSGWKDEYLTLFITGLVAACFVPPLQPYVDAGFDTLTNETPLWFQVSFLIVVGSAFGVRVFDNFKRLLKS